MMATLTLSQLILDAGDRRVRRDLANVYELHRTILSAFPETLPDGERVLFRLDEGGDGRLALLVQSRAARPEWGRLPAGYLLPADPFDPTPNPAVKAVELAFSRGQVLRFRLRANPTIKKARPGRKQGHRVAIIREEAQLDWLGRKAEAGGFLIRPADVRVAEPGREFGLTKPDAGADKRHRVELHVVQFDGLLEVTDPARFGETLLGGIGSAKGFGCGLLSLARG